MDVKKVGVVGCGLMGRGIVEISAKAGFDVVVSEVSKDFLDKGLAAIKSSLSKAVEKGKSTEAEMKAAMDHIKGTTNMEDHKDRDLVIEAVVENMDLKKKIFSDLDKICQPSTIIATNTSCLSIIEMASVTKRQDKVLGMHFFNPVPVMKLLELVKTISTSDATLNVAKAFGEATGKSCIIAPDIPGFIVNRILFPFLLEAIKLYEAGLATKEDIDKGIMLGLNHPMGPLTLLDFVGIETAYFVTEAMFDVMKETRFAAPVLMRQMVKAGMYGRKTGKGFYDYK
jgi:3-hydroxybutyryl-CoA dehydrogenase